MLQYGTLLRTYADPLEGLLEDFGRPFGGLLDDFYELLVAPGSPWESLIRRQTPGCIPGGGYLGSWTQEP